MAELFKRYKATFIAAALLAAALIALLVASMRSRGGGSDALVALVHDGDGAVHELALDRDGTYDFETSLGTNTVAVEDGLLRMAAADCPHGDCLRQSAISKPGEQIICLPHELWIEIAAQGAQAGEMDEGAVAYDDGVDTVAR